MESGVISTAVHSRKCIGCKRTKSDIMITMSTPGSEEDKVRGLTMNFNDFFLNTKQAETLVTQLKQRLKENE